MILWISFLSLDEVIDVLGFDSKRFHLSATVIEPDLSYMHNLYVDSGDIPVSPPGGLQG